MMGGENLYANKNMFGCLEKMSTQVFHKRSFCLADSSPGNPGSGIPKIIQTGLVLVLLVFTMYKLSN